MARGGTTNSKTGITNLLQILSSKITKYVVLHVMNDSKTEHLYHWVLTYKSMS